MNPVNEKEHCVAAALKLTTGEIVQGKRHDNCFTILIDRGSETSAHFNAIQGFVTNTGRFVDRYDAMKIQKAAGIKSAYNKDGIYYGKILFSEDLY